jgi:uncharacterized protein YdaU (DUF1376 family)
VSLPYFHMYPSDFEAKTSHLTIAEDGAYNRLLRICWMTPGCTIPTDEAWIMRRVRARTDADKETVRAVLSEFFTVENGRYSNAKLMRIWLASNEAHEKRKNAGAKGGKAKSLKTINIEPSNALAMAKQPEPEPEPIERRDTDVSLRKSDCFSAFWVSWPNKVGKVAAEKAWRKLSKADQGNATKSADGWFQRWRSQNPQASPIHPATYLNQKRWADEIEPERNSNGKRSNAGSARRDAHSALFAGFGAEASGNDGGGPGPSGAMRDVTPPGEQAMADGPGGNASQPFLRVANVRT